MKDNIRNIETISDAEGLALLAHPIMRPLTAAITRAAGLSNRNRLYRILPESYASIYEVFKKILVEKININEKELLGTVIDRLYDIFNGKKDRFSGQPLSLSTDEYNKLLAIAQSFEINGENYKELEDAIKPLIQFDGP